MGAIFWFSAQPSTELPDFNWAEKLVKKSGHVLGYGILAICYWYGLRMEKDKRWLAWLLTIFYAATDEYHQSFTPGRFASVWDIALFDNLGALVALWLAARYIKQKRSDSTSSDRQ